MPHLSRLDSQLIPQRDGQAELRYTIVSEMIVGSDSFAANLGVDATDFQQAKEQFSESYCTSLLVKGTESSHLVNWH